MNHELIISLTHNESVMMMMMMMFTEDLPQTVSPPGEAMLRLHQGLVTGLVCEMSETTWCAHSLMMAMVTIIKWELKLLRVRIYS